MKRSIQKGFTLIELMIVVAIVGILAAVALPQYRTFTVKARVSQVISSLDQIKTCISDQYQNANGGTMANSDVSVACTAPTNAYFPAINANATGVTVAGAATAVGVAVTATLVNNYSAVSTGIGGNMTWTCTGTPVAYFPAGCRG